MQPALFASTSLDLARAMVAANLESALSGDMLWPVSGGVTCLVRLHALVFALQTAGIFSLSARLGERVGAVSRVGSSLSPCGRRGDRTIT